MPRDSDFGNQLAHLQAPIAQMDIADHLPAIGAIKPLQAIADDGGTQMTHMHGLGDIGAAEIDQQGLAVAGLGRGIAVAAMRGIERRIGQIQIDEAGTGDLDLGELRDRLSAARRSSRRWRADWPWLLSPPPARHCTGTGQIGPVGQLTWPKRSVQSFGGEGLAHGARQIRGQGRHGA